MSSPLSGGPLGRVRGSNSSAAMNDQPTEPRRIAFCITELDPGGAERAFVRIVTGLDPARWQPTVFCLGPEAELVSPLRERGIPVECYGARNWRSWGVIPWLTRRLQQLQPSLIQSFLFHANIVSRIAGRRAGVPVIVSGHRVAEQGQRWHLLADRLTRSWVDHHVCVSRGVADHIMQHVGIRADQLSVIPNGVDLPTTEPPPFDLSAEFGIPKGAPVIVAAGRLHPQKGFLLLLDAFALVVQQHPEARLLILGEGPQRQGIEEKIEELGILREVVTPGYRSEFRAILRAAAIFVLSSKWEGMPNVVLEAMAAGVPVVSTPVAGIAELIENERTGLVVTSMTAGELAKSISRLLADRGSAADLSRCAQHLVKERFTWESSVQKYERLYAELISQPTKTRK